MQSEFATAPSMSQVDKTCDLDVDGAPKPLYGCPGFQVAGFRCSVSTWKIKLLLFVGVSLSQNAAVDSLHLALHPVAGNDLSPPCTVWTTHSFLPSFNGWY